MKRTFSFILAFTMLLACCSGAALAVNPSGTRASLTLSYHVVTLSKGSSRGTVTISYDVKASKAADSIGVESIVIYKADGSYVTTIYGSTSNGLVSSGSSIRRGYYDYAGTSGTSYYAEVTLFAQAGSESDSRTITTDTVKAP